MLLQISIAFLAAVSCVWDGQPTRLQEISLNSPYPDLRALAIQEFSSEKATRDSTNRLIQWSRDTHEEVRRAAIGRLGQAAKYPNESIPALVSCLSDPSEVIRSGAAFALSRFGSRAVSEIVEVADDPTYFEGVIEALMRLNDRGRKEIISRLDNAPFAAIVASRLAWQRKPDTTIFSQLFTRPHSRRHALTTLRNLGEGASYRSREINDYLPETLPAPYRLAAKLALRACEVENEAETASIVKMFDSDDPALRATAAWFTGMHPGEVEDGVDRLMMLLSDSDAEVRLYAIWGLGNMLSPKGPFWYLGDGLVPGVPSDHMAVSLGWHRQPKDERRFLEWDATYRRATEELHIPEEKYWEPAPATLLARLDEISSLLSDESAEVQRVAAWTIALGASEIEKFQGSLPSLFTNPDPKVRSDGLRLVYVSSQVTDELAPRIEDLLEDENVNVRMFATEVLIMWESMDVVARRERALELIGFPDTVVAGTAAKLLAALDGINAEALEPLVQASERGCLEALAILPQLGEQAIGPLVEALDVQDVPSGAVFPSKRGLAGSVEFSSLQVTERDVRGMALVALASMGESATEAIPAIERVAGDAKGALGRAAREALDSIRGSG